MIGYNKILMFISSAMVVVAVSLSRSQADASIAPLAAFPAPYAAIAPFASSYSAHSINHALAASLFAAPPAYPAYPALPAALPAAFPAAPLYPGLSYPYPYLGAAAAW